MTVKELREKLSGLPEDQEVLHCHITSEGTLFDDRVELIEHEGQLFCVGQGAMCAFRTDLFESII